MDDALSEIGMDARDARVRSIFTTAVCVGMLLILVISQVWTWAPVWFVAFFLLVIVGILWQTWNNPFQRTVVFTDRLETRRRSGVMAVVFRESITSFRVCSGGDDTSYIEVEGSNGERVKLPGTDHARTSRLGDTFRFRSRRTEKPDLLVQLEYWKQHGVWNRQ